MNRKFLFTISLTTGELSVRLWNLDTGDNFVLTGNTGTGGHSEFISSLAWSSAKSSLAAGTNLGNIVMWRHQPDLAASDLADSEHAWVQEPVSRYGCQIFLGRFV